MLLKPNPTPAELAAAVNVAIANARDGDVFFGPWTEEFEAALQKLAADPTDANERAARSISTPINL